jgi:hypothetical protein
MLVYVAQVANLDIWFDINPFGYEKKKFEKQFPFSVHHAKKISKKIRVKFSQASWTVKGKLATILYFVKCCLNLPVYTIRYRYFLYSIEA